MHRKNIIFIVCGSSAFLAGIAVTAFVILSFCAKDAPPAVRIRPVCILPVITALIFFSLWKRLWNLQPDAASSLPFIPFLFLALFALDFFHGAPPEHGISAGLIALSTIGSLFFIFMLPPKRRKPFFNHLERWAHAYLWSTIAIATITFLIFNWIKMNNFDFNGKDTALNMQALWSAVHGRPFYVSLMRGPQFHFHPIAFIFVPYYALFPKMWSLIILRTVAITVTAGIVFAILRTRLSRPASLVLAIAYLLQPPIYHQTIYEFIWIEVAPAFLALTLLFLFKEKKTPFVIATLLAIVCREDISLTIIALGMYALFAKKEKFWILYPLALGAAWIILVRKVLPPCLMQSPERYDNLSIFAMGPEESYHLLTHDPIGFLSFFFTFAKIRYIFLLLLPAGLMLPLFSLTSILALPSIALVLSFRSWFPFHSVWHYGMPASLFLLLGCGFSIAKISRSNLYSIRWKSTALALLVLLLSAMLAYRSNLHDWFIGDTFRSSSYTNAPPATLQMALRTIPDTSSVFAPRYLLPWLANREVACLSIAPHRLDDPDVKPYNPYEIDYLIIDEATIHRITKAKYDNDFVRGLPDNPSFRIIFSRDGVIIYRRVTPGPSDRAP